MARRTPASTPQPASTRSRARKAPASPAEPHLESHPDEAATPHSEPHPAIRPEVIVDFTVEGGLLFVVLHNIGAASAYRVVTRFDQPFRGLGGRKEISSSALFRSLLFMPPAKQFTQLVDPIGAYFRRDEPRRLTATITYTDREGRRYSEVVPHDLDIYRDLAETVPR